MYHLQNKNAAPFCCSKSISLCGDSLETNATEIQLSRRFCYSSQFFSLPEKYREVLWLPWKLLPKVLVTMAMQKSSVEWLLSGHCEVWQAAWCTSMRCVKSAEIHIPVFQCLQLRNIMQWIRIMYSRCGNLMKSSCVLLFVYCMIIVHCSPIYMQVKRQACTLNKSHNTKKWLKKVFNRIDKPSLFFFTLNVEE